MDSLTKTKEFDKVRIAKGGLSYNEENALTHAKACSKKSCSYCNSHHPTKQCPAYGKMYAGYSKINHFREVYKSRRNTAVYNIEQEPDQYNIEEDHIDTVNINLIIFNSKWSALNTNLKTSSTKVSIIIS